MSERLVALTLTEDEAKATLMLFRQIQIPDAKSKQQIGAAQQKLEEAFRELAKAPPSGGAEVEGAHAGT